jgi:excisionase family DNA binding protein
VNPHHPENNDDRGQDDHDRHGHDRSKRAERDEYMHGRDNGEFDDLFTLAELANLLRVPPATLRYWRHRGTGPDSFRIGRHVRYYRTDVESWLRHQRHANGPGVA